MCCDDVCVCVCVCVCMQALAAKMAVDYNRTLEEMRRELKGEERRLASKHEFAAKFEVLFINLVASFFSSL